LLNFAKPGAAGGPFSPTHSQKTGLLATTPGITGLGPAVGAAMHTARPGLFPQMQPGQLAPGTSSQQLPSQASQVGNQLAASTGISLAELQQMCSSERFHVLARSLRRAAPEIYFSCRQGYGCIEDWFIGTWGGAPRSKLFNGMWHACTTVDLSLDQALAPAPDMLAQTLMTNDVVESHSHLHHRAASGGQLLHHHG